MSHRGNLEVICGPMWSGKCLGEDTPILMHNGIIKSVQDIKQGDIIMGDDSSPRNVLSICSGESELFKVTPSFGDPYVVNDEHILSLKCSFAPKKYENTVNPKFKKGKVVNISVKDFLAESKSFRSYYKGYRVGVEFKHTDVPLDPYILGIWLGDGTSKVPEITSIDIEVINALKDYANGIGLFVRNYKISYHVTTGVSGRKNHFTETLRLLNVFGNKHIPFLYKSNSRDIRLSVLAGLLDTDGCYNEERHSYSITQKSEALSYDIVFLARSLGFVCYWAYAEKYCVYKGERRYGLYYNIHISGSLLHEIPCRIPRKKAVSHTNRNDLLVGINVESIGFGKYYGFEIDGNHLFLLGDFTVTHNTSEIVRRVNRSLYIKKRCIIITPAKERYGTSKLCTHDLHKTEENEDNLKQIVIDFSIGEEHKIYQEILEKKETDVIFIDEAQFIPNLVDTCSKFVENGINVIVSALDMDYRTEPFTEIALLMAKANSVLKLDALCYKCGGKASYSERFSDDVGVECVGGSDKYRACCKDCFDFDKVKNKN